MTNFVDCKLMLTKSLRCMLLLEMSIFCKYKSLSNANLSNSQFDRIDFSYVNLFQMPICQTLNLIE